MATLHDLMRKLDRFKEEIQGLSSFNIRVTPDRNGMFDRQCPKEICSTLFKVNVEDWKNIVRNEEVFCPVCNNNSAAKEYLPKEQRAAVVNNLRTSIKAFWDHGYPVLQNIRALHTSEEFDVHVQCEKCQVRYAVSGVPYFCPCCGYNSVEKTAEDSVRMLMLKAEKIADIQTSLEQTVTKDEAAVIARSIIENSLSDCIGTLQAYSEAKYNLLSASRAPFNAFQNTDKSDKLWVALKGVGYHAWLSAKENRDLVIFTNRRHLVEHKGGMVDKKYITSTGDSHYLEGQKIVVRPEDITALGNIVLKIISAINQLK